MKVDYDLKIRTQCDGLTNEIEYIELITREDGRKSNKLHFDVKKLLDSSIDHQHVIVEQGTYIDVVQTVNEKIKKVLTFGCRETEEFLMVFVQKLDNHMSFLDTRTTVADCVRMMTSPNLELVKEKIYLACHTNEFKYILECLKPFFKYLTIANIERSGIFISNLGNPITANCLYNSKTQKLHTKPIINTVFHR